MLFAVIAGAGTALTPCVLPVLPAVLSASAAGGRRRPVGIVAGIAVTFTIAIVALAQLVKGVGLASGVTRTIAVIVLLGFGVVMLWPELAARVEAPLSRLARFGPRSSGDGFWSGLGVGGALGFVMAPCAGPILAAVTAVSASGHTSARLVAVAISYSAGLCAMLLLYALGSRRVLDRVRRSARGPAVMRGLGVVMLITGVAMATNLDVRFEEALAKGTSNNGSGLLAFVVDPTRSLENSGVVQSRLNSLRPVSRFVARQRTARPHRMGRVAGVAIPGVGTPSLSDLGPAPDFTGTQQWFNTPGGRPLTLASLRGKVVLVDFWTYTCINCIRTFPYLRGLYATYHRYGLEIVGVHTPEFTFEQEAGNVAQAIKSDGLRYPVVQDNNYATWNAYQNQYWPADYLIDAHGRVRYTHFGEGDYKPGEAAIRQLLHDAGARQLPPPMTTHALVPSAGLSTPETYLNTQRSQGFSPALQNGVHTYAGVAHAGLNVFALRGRWRVSSHAATPAGPGAAIELGFQAAHVYLVMTSTSNVAGRATILLDGQPIGAADAGTDVHGATVTVLRDGSTRSSRFPACSSTISRCRCRPGSRRTRSRSASAGRGRADALEQTHWR